MKETCVKRNAWLDGFPFEGFLSLTLLFRSDGLTGATNKMPNLQITLDFLKHILIIHIQRMYTYFFYQSHFFYINLTCLVKPDFKKINKYNYNLNFKRPLVLVVSINSWHVITYSVKQLSTCFHTSG